MSNNLKILIILHLKRVVQRPPVLLSTRKKLHQRKKHISGTCSKRPPNVGTSTIVVPPDPLSSTPPTFSATKTPENTQKDPNDPNQQMKETS
jgi:hypothetical protein